MIKKMQKATKLQSLRQSLITELDDLFLFTSNLSRRAYFSSEKSSSGGGIFGMGGGEPKAKDKGPVPRHKQRIVTKRGQPPLSLKKKLDEPNTTPEYIALQSVFSVKTKTYSRCQSFMSKKLESFKKQINQKNHRLSKILPYAKESILKVNKVENGADRLEISLWNPSLYSLNHSDSANTNVGISSLGNNQMAGSKPQNKGYFEETPEWSLSIENFREECEQKFGWISGEPESHKNGKCLIEIISNIGSIQIVRINCERLLSKTRYVKDTAEEWDALNDRVLEQAKITEYLLKLSNLKLFDAIAEKKKKEEENFGIAGSFNQDTKRIELYKKGNLIQVSLVKEGDETAITNRQYKTCVRNLLFYLIDPFLEKFASFTLQHAQLP